jgi:hypothetical protein
MGTNRQGFTTRPSQMTREELQNFVLGFVDHRIAVIEERLSALEHREPLPQKQDISDLKCPATPTR